MHACTNAMRENPVFIISHFESILIMCLHLKMRAKYHLYVLKLFKWET